MAFTTVIFENDKTGQLKEAPVGFSWTVFFFGIFPPLFRSDWKWASIILVLALVSAGLSNVVFAFIYNRIYIKELVGQGFKGKSSPSGDFDLVNANVGFKIPLLN